MKRPNRKRRRQAPKESPTNPQYIFSRRNELELRKVQQLERIASALNGAEISGIRIEAKLNSIAGELHYMRNRLEYLSNISSPLWKIAEILERPTFWQRIRIRVMKWRWRRRVAKGLPQKEWSEKTREALEAFEKRVDGQSPHSTDPAERWGSVWR